MRRLLLVCLAGDPGDDHAGQLCTDRPLEMRYAALTGWCALSSSFSLSRRSRQLQQQVSGDEFDELDEPASEGTSRCQQENASDAHGGQVGEHGR